MRLSTKRLIAVVILAVVLVSLLLQVPNVHSAELTAPEKALAFLSNVLLLDLTKYNVKLERTVNYPSDFLGGQKDKEITYRLESAVNSLEVACDFRNNTLIFLGLYGLRGSSFYAKMPPTDMLDAAKGLMQRYQAYSGASYLQVMREMLESVTVMKPMTKVSGNVKLCISSNEPYTYFDWTYTVNGIDVERKQLRFAFYNGSFEYFGNSWDLYTVGSADLKVSREGAIRIAREHMQNYSWGVGDIIVRDFTILDSPVSAELSMQPREGNMLYPWWNIRLYLDKVYPGMIGSIQVGLWADTGEITNIVPISTGGSIIQESPPASIDELSSLNVYLIAMTIAIIAVTAGVALALKKRRK
ncbi:MAG: hypothetical protein QXD70_04905 [Candidatus Bathyarchaeia archaeon]